VSVCKLLCVTNFVMCVYMFVCVFICVYVCVFSFACVLFFVRSCE